MAYINDNAFDAALDYIGDNATTLHICSQEPATRAEAAVTYTLGNKAISFTGPAAGDTSGRKITVDAITDGSVTGDGTASHWALVDGSVLYATGALSESQGVTDGNTFTLDAIDIEIRDAT